MNAAEIVVRLNKIFIDCTKDDTRLFRTYLFSTKVDDEVVAIKLLADNVDLTDTDSLALHMGRTYEPGSSFVLTESEYPVKDKDGVEMTTFDMHFPDTETIAALPRGKRVDTSWFCKNPHNQREQVIYVSDKAKAFMDSPVESTEPVEVEELEEV